MTVAYQFDGQYDPVKRKRRKKIAIDPNWDGLTQDAAQARNAGVSYGKWKAKQWEKERRRRKW